MNKEIISIGLNRAKLLAVNPNTSASPRLKAIFLGELAELGYKVENPELFNDSVFENFDNIINILIEMKGGDVDYIPLFSGFPNKVPNKDEYCSARVIGFFGNVLGLFEDGDIGTKTLENGLVIPNWLFDLTEFGADPILGRQTEELFEQGKINQARRKGDTYTHFINIKFSNDIENDVKLFLENNLYAKSSIKEALKDDIETLIQYYGLDFLDANKVVFKEVKSYVMKSLWFKNDFINLDKYISTPTDILRMFAAITDGDISLATNIKFPKLRRADRKFILSQLEKCSNIEENLNMYKGLWLNLGRYIHPGEYKSAYPKAFKAFDILRNSKVITFNGALEGAIKNRDLGSVLKLVSSRPGIFGRKLHEIIDKFSDETGVIREFKSIAANLELKNLLILEKYFETINDLDYKTVINKKGKVIVFPNDKKGTLSEARINKLLTGIRDAIKSKISTSPIKFEEGSKIWIDPELRNYTVPLSLRKQSDGLMNISRGTRIKFDKTKVLRLFTYWKENNVRTDFDSSIIEFDEDMNFKGQVSYTNLSEAGLVHSGDITSAPEGAAEFIDIDMNKLKDGVRYLAIQIFKFSGEGFNQVDISYSGWMVRDKVNKSRSSFDIKTVANKFNVTGQGAYAIPMIVDVKTGEIIYIDLYMNGHEQFNRVEGAINDISIITRELIKMIDTKPNMLDLIKYQVISSGFNVVESKEDASITYGINDCTYSVDRVDEILANLL